VLYSASARYHSEGLISPLWRYRFVVVVFYGREVCEFRSLNCLLIRKFFNSIGLFGDAMNMFLLCFPSFC